MQIPWYATDTWWAGCLTFGLKLPTSMERCNHKDGFLLTKFVGCAATIKKELRCHGNRAIITGQTDRTTHASFVVAKFYLFFKSGTSFIFCRCKIPEEIRSIKIYLAIIHLLFSEWNSMKLMGFENNVKLKRVPTSYTGNGRQNNIMVDDLDSTNILRSSFLIVSVAKRRLLW